MKCQPRCSVWRIGSQASPDGLKRLGCDGGQRAGLRGAAIFLIHVQQQFHIRSVGAAPGVAPPGTPEHTGQSGADPLQLALADTGQTLESPIPGRCFELFERVDVKLAVDVGRQHRPDVRDRLQQGFRVERATHTFQLTPAAAGNELADRRRDALADRGQPDQALQPLLIKNIGHAPVQLLDGVGRIAIGGYPEWIGALLSEEFSGLVQLARYLLVYVRVHWLSIEPPLIQA